MKLPPWWRWRWILLGVFLGFGAGTLGSAAQDAFHDPGLALFGFFIALTCFGIAGLLYATRERER